MDDSDFHGFDEDFIRQFGAIFQQLQKEIAKMMENGTFDPSKLNLQSFGFSIGMSPDGMPQFGSMEGFDPANLMKMFEQQSDGWEEPEFEVHVSDRFIQIVAELPGVEPEQMHVELKGQKIQFEGDAGEGYRYRKALEVTHKFKEKSLTVNKSYGILEILLEKA